MTKGESLNKEQIEAITYGNGPLLIIAGAGTGKTTVITQRIKHLILKKKVSPSEILALTFTEKAATEMEERVDIDMPYGYTQMWISTFHAFCDRILRSEAIHIGLNPSFSLLTEAETVLFLRNNIFKFNLEYFRPLGNPNKFLEGMLQHFSRIRDEDISPNEYLRWAKKLDAEKDEVKKNLELANAFIKYQDLKAKESIMDFADLITNVLLLFRTRANILKQYQQQFRYVLVDEFQDVNFAQNQLAILLAGHSTLRNESSGSDSKSKKENITVVGDDDQAIYRWRGAAISNIIQFKKHFPKTKIVTLTKNYRSTKEVLDKSYKLIQFNNPDRLEVKEKVDKKLISTRQIKGKDLELLFGNRAENEADLVAKKIIELITENEKKTNYSYSDIAILVRANDHAQSFTRALQRYNIPFQFLGPGRLFRQEEIKDLIAYLKILYNFDDSASLYRVLNIPIFKITARDIAALLNFARRKNLTLFSALEKVVADPTQQELFFVDKTKDSFRLILNMIKRHLKHVPKDSAGQILYYFLDDSGMLKQFLNVNQDVKKYQNIAKFFDKLKSYETSHEDASVFSVVEWIDLSMQMGESPIAEGFDLDQNNAVNILTVHSSKGLEFPIVFLVNIVSQRFPTRERKEQIPIPQELIKEILPVGDYHMQEERRLFYVGMTRAKDQLYFSAANYYGEGKQKKKLSPFVYESLGEKEVEKIIKKSDNANTQDLQQLSLLNWSIPVNQTVSEKGNKVTPVTYLSYSQLQTFDICPLHYKLRYIIKVPGITTAAQSFGTSLHATLRDFYQLKISGEKPSEKNILTLLNKNWIDEGYTNSQHQKQALEKAKYVLTKYIKDNYKETDAYPIGIEIPFQFTIKDEKQQKTVKIGGRVDRVDRLTGNKIEIIDYKTGSNVPRESELKNNLQLTLYAMAAMNVKDIMFNRMPQDVILSLVFLEEEKKLTTTRNRQQLEDTKEYIFKKIGEIENSDFACSQNMLCQNCEYKMLCSTG